MFTHLIPILFQKQNGRGYEFLYKKNGRGEGLTPKKTLLAKGKKIKTHTQYFPKYFTPNLGQ